MSGRKITVTLTDKQYLALQDAISHRDSYYEGDPMAEADPKIRSDDRARENAWRKIQAAWRGRAA